MAIGAIAPAFAMVSSVHTHISAPVYQSNEQTSSPKNTASIKATQVSSPDSWIVSGSGKNSFGVAVSNQDNTQSSHTSVHQNTNISQDAHNLNLQAFNVQTTSTLFCIYDHKGSC
jgi:hypothetical protein